MVSTNSNNELKPPKIWIESKSTDVSNAIIHTPNLNLNSSKIQSIIDPKDNFSTTVKNSDMSGIKEQLKSRKIHERVVKKQILNPIENPWNQSNIDKYLDKTLDSRVPENILEPDSPTKKMLLNKLHNCTINVKNRNTNNPYKSYNLVFSNKKNSWSTPRVGTRINGGIHNGEGDDQELVFYNAQSLQGQKPITSRSRSPSKNSKSPSKNVNVSY